MRRVRQSSTGVSRVAVVVFLAVVLSGCWYSPRGGPRNLGAQPFELKLKASDVSQLHPLWHGQGFVDESPVVVDTATAFQIGSGQFHAYPVGGGALCPGQDAVCPSWYGTLPGYGHPSDSVAMPVLTGRYAIAVYSALPLADTHVYAFDEAGIDGCAGTPKFCEPVWQAVLPGVSRGGATVDNGRVYVTTSNTFGVFDAAGVTGCSGTPTTCLPLWTAVTGSNKPATVADGRVFVATAGNGVAGNPIDVFDAAGITGCSASPVTCQPLYQLRDDGALLSMKFGVVAVNNGLAYSIGLGRLFVWDATGTKNCSGTPAVCTQLWADQGVGDGVPAIAGGMVYAVTNGGVNGSALEAFDATGTSGCSGVPRECSPLWSGVTGFIDFTSGGPSIAGGLAYVSSLDGHLYVFDAHGVDGCTGTPIVCQPIDTEVGGGSSQPVSIAGGQVYVASGPQVFGV